MKDFKDITEIYKEVLGYEPDLENPVTFNEKIQYKKLNDRDPLLPLTADKYRVRDYIKEKSSCMLQTSPKPYRLMICQSLIS